MEDVEQNKDNIKKDLLFIFLLTFAGPALIVYLLNSKSIVVLSMLIYGPILWYVFYGTRSIKCIAFIGIILSIIGLILIFYLTSSLIYTIPFLTTLIFTGYTYFKIKEIKKN